MQVLADPDQDRCSVTFARSSLHRSAFTENQDEELTSEPKHFRMVPNHHHCLRVDLDAIIHRSLPCDQPLV